VREAPTGTRAHGYITTRRDIVTVL
jgi:hypothetical protein